MQLDRIDRRALGSIRLIDNVTGNRLRQLGQLRPVSAGQPPTITLIRNRRGDFVMTQAAALADHDSRFATPPATPAIGSVAIDLQFSDPSGHYLPRRFQIALPRDPDPANAIAANSLFRAITIPVFRSPQARVDPNWAIIRATVLQSVDGALVRLPWAWIDITRTEDPALQLTSMADWRGEALIAVPGVPVAISNGEMDPEVEPDPEASSTTPIVSREVSVTIQISFDAANLQTIPAAAELSTLTDPNADYVPPATRPGAIADSFTYSLVAGQDQPEQFLVTLPPP